jgi:hypothetical protein
MTENLHVITIYQMEQLSNEMQRPVVSRYYYKPQLTALVNEWEIARTLGSAMEWLKGLESRQRKNRNDCARVERYEESPSLRLRAGQIQERVRGRFLETSSDVVGNSYEANSKSFMFGPWVV